MGNKIDIVEVSALSDELSSAAKDITAQLDSIKSDIDQINTLDSFSGKAATQAKRYFNDLHKTVLESFNGLFIDIDNQLKEHLSSFQSSVDTSVTTIIESDYLNENRMDINGDYNKLRSEHESINRTINNVADISSVSAPIFSSVTNGKSEVVETIFDLEENLSSFTSEGKQHDSQAKDLLHHIETTINRANTQAGEARFTDYHSGSANVGLAVLKDYTNTQSEEDTENLNDDEKAIIAKAEEDYENGIIDESTYNSIRSGIIATGAVFVRNALTSKVTNEVSEKIAGSIVQWAQNNTTHFVNRGLVAAPVHGNIVTFTEPPTILSQTIRTGARYGVPIVGSVIDFGIQVYNGEDATDAAIKSVGHLGAGMAGAAIGSAIPVIGTFGGFLVGVGLSMAFDWVYDNADVITEGLQDFAEGTIEAVTNVGEQIGDAVSGVFDGLGSLFG